MKNEIIFGEHKNFRIRYIAGWKSKDHKCDYATLHLILDGQIIGDSRETCLLKTWLSKVEVILEKIDHQELYHPEFENRSDEEIFRMIYKSNQLEDEFDEKYHYLPVLPNEVWVNCNVIIDETIDAYFLTMIAKENKIKFIWKRWRAPCPNQQLGVINSITLNRKLVSETIFKCLSFVKSDSLNYKIR